MNPELPDWLKSTPFPGGTPGAGDALSRAPSGSSLRSTASIPEKSSILTLLLKQGTNIHSDLDGVSRIPFSDNVEDKFLDIQKELKAAKIIA